MLQIIVNDGDENNVKSTFYAHEPATWTRRNVLLTPTVNDFEVLLGLGLHSRAIWVKTGKSHVMHQPHK